MRLVAQLFHLLTGLVLLLAFPLMALLGLLGWIWRGRPHP